MELIENDKPITFPTEAINANIQSPSESHDLIQFPNNTVKHEDEQQPEEKQQPPLDFSKFPRVRNRKEARAFAKLLSKSGKTKNEIDNIIELSKALAKSYEAEGQTRYKQSLGEGDIVKLDIDKMRNNPSWSNLQESYIEYVSANIDTIFSVRLIDKFQGNNAIVNLADENDTLSPWQFNANDLLVYDKTDSTFKAMWLIEEETE